MDPKFALSDEVVYWDQFIGTISKIGLNSQNQYFYRFLDFETLWIAESDLVSVNSPEGVAFRVMIE